MLPRIINPSTHTQDGQRKVQGLNKVSLLLLVLGIAIFAFSIAPIFIHHSVGVHHISNIPLHRLHQPGVRTVEYKINDNEVFNLAYEDDPSINVTLPPDIGGAGKFLLLNALQKRPVWDEEIDVQYETERCQRYYAYTNHTKYFRRYKPRKRRRRLFLGSLIADDSWHSLAALAMETYGLYTAVVFVEGNRTQTGAPRKLRFVNGTAEHKILVESNLFGPNTPVLVEQYSNEVDKDIDGGGLIREHMQRQLIIDTWKKAGMTQDDVGVLTDADETPTRDFLRAAQTCDMPELNPKLQDCHTADVISSSMVFEGSPECMTVTRKWMHPDLILGKCIEGIGDDEFKLTDKQRQRKYAWRKKEYTEKFSNYSGWPKKKKTYPLWNAADFRRDQGGHIIYFEQVDYLSFGMGHTGYHFHNYFETTEKLRKKYTTYGHPIKDASNLSIGEMHPDLDVMLDCVLGRPTTDNHHFTLSRKLEEYPGRIPIAYGIEGYSMARHYELKSILELDERKHNPGSRTWHHNPRSKDWYENIPP